MGYKKRTLIMVTALACVLWGNLICGTGCRNDPLPPQEKIERIIFDKERVDIKINEETTVRVTVKPDSAKKNEIIEYASVNEGIIEIREPTNDGFIVKGLKGGSTVIMAKSGLATSYIEVVVAHENIAAQYITVAQPVIEMLEGERRSTQVSLYGGSVLDNNDFVWRLENGKNNISIQVTSNIAVIAALERGHQKIIVSHPRADYESEILIFVKGIDESIQYISSQSNVVLVPNDEQYHEFEVVLVNGKREDNLNFEYKATQGAANIEIAANGNVCNIKGKKSGTSVIKITHPLAVMDFDIRIIVYDVIVPYIVLDQTFLLMNIGDSANVAAEIENAKNEVFANNQFTYQIAANSENIIEVIQNNNHFYIWARHGGNARIIISNEQAQMSREILIVVRNETVYRDDFYITTSQNVILTQVGDSEVQLNIQLANGNNADANGFEWVVDDGTVIAVESYHGTVKGNRSMVNSVFNAAAFITPKQTGTAKITISHPKSEITTVVMVKVYPRGTFAGQPILVGTNGLITVTKGTPKTIQLSMVSGDILNVGNLDWSITDTGIAAINTDVHGMVNIINGIDNGLTKLSVSGNKLEYPHESLVLSGTPEFIDMTSVIYADTVYQKMVTGQTVRMEIRDSQEKYRNSNDYKAIAENNDVLYAVMIKNQLVLQGKNAGETKVRITHLHAINDITINVRVDPANITIDKPYYISGPEIIGVVRGIGKEINVSLAGAGETETGKLLWSVDDSGIAGIIANGKNCIITGRIQDRQTKITVRHQKSENEKIILVYVVENENDLYNKVALGLQNEHYLLTQGEEKLITLLTNANENQKLGLQWRVKYGDNVISIDPHYDSAIVRAMGAGNAAIEVSHEQNILPLTIYVSVTETMGGEKAIKGMPVIELLTGESKIVSLSHINLNQTEISNIRWSVEDSSIANIRENGDSAHLLGLKKGISYVNIKQDSIGYHHRATLLCANTPEELSQMYVMGVESSYHTMLTGDEKRIKLEFGSAGFPEAAKSAIRWNAGSEGVVRVIGSGESATIVAVNVGIGKVTVQSETSYNNLELTFEVRGNAINSYEFRGHEKIKGIVIGDTARITMRMYSGGTEITNGYSLLKYENENESIIGINTVDNILDITAKLPGQSYITVRHKQVNDPARILVYTAKTPEELDMYYPIMVEKTNYLLQMGESAVIRLETLESKDAQNLDNVQWGIQDAGVIENPKFNGKKEVTIKGKAEGQCVINISYQGKIVERVFITVVGNDTVDMTKYILTENIIGLVKGGSYTTRIFSNLSANEITSVLWESADENVVTVNGSGESAALFAVGNGIVNEAYVTVSYGSWLKRHILVYVCDSKEQTDNYRAMNMDNQYYRLGPNENIILPVYYAPNKTNTPTVWVDKYDNKVIRFVSLENGGKLEITALNEGIAVLEARNTGLNNPNGILRIYIEVSNRYRNSPKMPEAQYLTIAKTVYVMNPDESDIPLDLSVIGIGMAAEDLANIKWETEIGSQFVNIYPNGKDCQVRVNQSGLEGDAGLKIYHVNNILRVKIIVSRTGMTGFPHITGDDVIKIGLQEKRLLEYNVTETASYAKNLFSVSVVNGTNIVSAKMTGNVLEVDGKKSGQALLRISCSSLCDYSKEVLVIVSTTPDGLIYLTTKDNFSAIKIDEYKLLTVEMIGYDNAGDQGYIWTVDPEHREIISLNGSGRQAQVRGLKTGTAKITVKNDTYVDPFFNVVMYVRVSNSDFNAVYITTQKNIVSVIEGRSAYIEAELVNGKPEENNLFTWTSTTPHIISVEGAGSHVVVVGKQAGIGRIRISHASAVNSGLEILIIVERDTTSQGIYIATESALVDIKPNDTRQISVRLIGGDPEDIYGFQWNIPFWESIEKSITGKNQEVIRLVSSANGAYITGIRDGEATIRVTHPKTSYVLDIKVYVRVYSTIKFKQRSVIVNAGGSPAHIEVEAPPGITVQYTASSKIVNVSGTNSICLIEGKEEGVCIVNASDIRETMSDEIIVEVRKTENRIIRYIQTPDIIYNMTDWQSSLNRTMITGKTIGEKNNGQVFTDSDDKDIQWKISNGSDVIGFGYNAGSVQQLTDAGKTISVYANKPGTAEITATHPEMNAEQYEKKIYVYVRPYDANFRIDPVFLNMQVGQKLPVEATISNIPEINYGLVEWTVTQNEYGLNGIKIGKIDGNEIGNNVKAITGKKVEIEALREGVAQVRASFNNAPPLESTVYIEKKRSLEILDDNFIFILPNETKYIGYFVEPPGSDVAINTDYNEFINVIGHGPLDKFKNDPNLDLKLLKNGINGLIKISGKEREGYTQIRLISNNLERLVTVNTNYNYTFFMQGVYAGKDLEKTTVIRGKPGETKIIEYSVFPEHDKVYFLEGTGKTITKTIASPVRVDKDIHQLVVRLDNCGYTTIEYESEYNKATGLKLEIPVYVYYDRIDLDWICNIVNDTHNKSRKSRIDSASNAIYIANGETIRINYRRKGSSPNTYPVKQNANGTIAAEYPGADIEFVTTGYSTIGGNVVNVDNAEGVTIYNDKPDNVSIMGNDSLIGVNWAGTLNVKYKYSTGNKIKTEFTKTFMVYEEEWARK